MSRPQTSVCHTQFSIPPSTKESFLVLGLTGVLKTVSRLFLCSILLVSTAQLSTALCPQCLLSLPIVLRVEVVPCRETIHSDAVWASIHTVIMSGRMRPRYVSYFEVQDEDLFPHISVRSLTLSALAWVLGWQASTMLASLYFLIDDVCWRCQLIQ